MNSLKEITTNYLVEHLNVAYKFIKNGRGYICDGLACDYPVSCAYFLNVFKIIIWTFTISNVKGPGGGRIVG